MKHMNARLATHCSLLGKLEAKLIKFLLCYDAGLDAFPAVVRLFPEAAEVVLDGLQDKYTSQLHVIASLHQPATHDTIYKHAHLHAGIDVILLVVVEFCKLSGNAPQLFHPDTLCLHVTLKGLMKLLKCLCEGKRGRDEKREGQVLLLTTLPYHHFCKVGSFNVIIASKLFALSCGPGLDV